MTKRKIPMRQCVGCREMKDKRNMIRVIRAMDGGIRLDTTGKQNGRGAYLCHDTACLEKAVKSRALERSLHVAVPGEIYGALKKELETIERT